LASMQTVAQCSVSCKPKDICGTKPLRIKISSYTLLPSQIPSPEIPVNPEWRQNKPWLQKELLRCCSKREDP
jgi:hypothetical protein